MLLEADRLHIAYGDAPAIWDVSLQVDDGEIVAVIGPNGAGKTTLINAIAGILRIARGELRLAGANLAHLPSHLFCARGIALVPEGRRLFVRMSVEENLEIGCYPSAARKLRDHTLAHVYTLFPVLREKRNQPAGALSGGQQQMVAIGRALMACPKLLLLDEPSLGLAPSIVSQMFDIIREIHASGVAILLVEQNVVQAMDVATRAYVLEQGRIVAAGLPSVLLGETRIREAYLGV